MEKKIYIIHNIFSVFLIKEIVEISDLDCEHKVIVANKLSEPIIEGGKLLLRDFKNVSFMPCSTFVECIFNSNELKSAKTIFISNPWHKRMVFFIRFLHWNKKATLNLIDEGFASINENYDKAILKDVNIFIQVFYKLCYKIISFDTHFSIFNQCSHSYTKLNNFKNTVVLKLRTTRQYDQSYSLSSRNMVVVLGSESFKSEDIKGLVESKYPENTIFMLRDHPNVSRKTDFLDTPEIFVLKNLTRIIAVWHDRSSAGIILKELFNDLEVNDINEL